MKFENGNLLRTFIFIFQCAHNLVLVEVSTHNPTIDYQFVCVGVVVVQIFSGLIKTVLCEMRNNMAKIPNSLVIYMINVDSATSSIGL